jgi:hypothetical protein
VFSEKASTSDEYFNSLNPKLFVQSLLDLSHLFEHDERELYPTLENSFYNAVLVLIKKGNLSFEDFKELALETKAVFLPIYILAQEMYDHQTTGAQEADFLFSFEYDEMIEELIGQKIYQEKDTDTFKFNTSLIYLLYKWDNNSKKAHEINEWLDNSYRTTQDFEKLLSVLPSPSFSTAIGSNHYIDNSTLRLIEPIFEKICSAIKKISKEDRKKIDLKVIRSIVCLYQYLNYEKENHVTDKDAFKLIDKAFDFFNNRENVTLKVEASTFTDYSNSLLPVEASERSPLLTLHILNNTNEEINLKNYIYLLIGNTPSRESLDKLNKTRDIKIYPNKEHVVELFVHDVEWNFLQNIYIQDSSGQKYFANKEDIEKLKKFKLE